MQLAASGPAKRRKTASSSKKRRVARTPRYSLGLAKVGFPKKLHITHRYCETINITGTAGIPGVYIFSANGLYDPNITGTGHQPMYFDQCAALYDHYTVIRSHIRATFSSNQAAAWPTVFGVYVEDDGSSSISTSLASLLESVDSKSGQLAFGANETKTLTNNWKATQTFGPAALSDDNLQGTASANPTEQSSYCLFVGDARATNTVACDILVEIWYETIWEELKPIGTS